MSQEQALELNRIPASEAEAAAGVPGLYAIEGGGEGAGSGVPAPELYAVPGSVEASTDLKAVEDQTDETPGNALEAEAMTGDDECSPVLSDENCEDGDNAAVAARWQDLAAAAGKRVLSSVQAHSARRIGSSVRREAVTAPSYSEDDDSQYRSGGGGWYIRELIKKAIAKMEAKNHIKGCDCSFCSESH